MLPFDANAEHRPAFTALRHPRPRLAEFEGRTARGLVRAGTPARMVRIAQRGLEDRRAWHRLVVTGRRGRAPLADHGSPRRCPKLTGRLAACARVRRDDGTRNRQRRALSRRPSGLHQLEEQPRVTDADPQPIASTSTSARRHGSATDDVGEWMAQRLIMNRSRQRRSPRSRRPPDLNIDGDVRRDVIALDTRIGEGTWKTAATFPFATASHADRTSAVGNGGCGRWARLRARGVRPAIGQGDSGG